ncbi:hypothetical protein VTK73DRAFT_2550 [Phialemonium thermophilum]|uniref:Uncharacterized protein n=1 Tax=Phialemonium thermophilum TaxID=223376 RepID=A0ABR3VS00_9PEZI
MLWGGEDEEEDCASATGRFAEEWLPPCALVVAQERMRSIYGTWNEASFIEWAKCGVAVGRRRGKEMKGEMK